MENIPIHDKRSITAALGAQYHTLLGWLKAQPTAHFALEKYPDKWTAGQHIQHLLMSTEPLNQALKLPKLALKTMFGKKNDRPERSFAELKTDYLEKLATRTISTNKFEPNPVQNEQKAELMLRLTKELQQLEKNIQRWDEDQLSVYLLPHPLLGKLTVREMLFFTIYHTSHHHRTLVEKY